METVCVYELVSPKDYVYVGITNNLRRRIDQHSGYHINNIYKDHRDGNGYTFDDFSIRVAEKELCRKKAKQIEKQLILKYEDEGRSLNHHGRTDLNDDTYEVEMPNGEIKEI